MPEGHAAVVRLVCDPSLGSTAVSICQIDGQWLDTVCASQASCVQQPNSLGVCVP